MSNIGRDTDVVVTANETNSSDFQVETRVAQTLDEMRRKENTANGLPIVRHGSDVVEAAIELILKYVAFDAKTAEMFNSQQIDEIQKFTSEYMSAEEHSLDQQVLTFPTDGTSFTITVSISDDGMTMVNFSYKDPGRQQLQTSLGFKETIFN